MKALEGEARFEKPLVLLALRRKSISGCLLSRLLKIFYVLELKDGSVVALVKYPE